MTGGSHPAVCGCRLRSEAAGEGTGRSGLGRDGRQSISEEREIASHGWPLSAWPVSFSTCGPELLLLDRDADDKALHANHTAVGDHLHRNSAVQIDRPIDVQFNAAAGRQRHIGKKGESATGKVHGLALSSFRPDLPVQDHPAYCAFDRKPDSVSALVFWKRPYVSGGFLNFHNTSSLSYRRF